MKLTSSRTQLPYEYYSLPFCQPSKITYKAENLGKFFSLTAVNLSQGESIGNPDLSIMIITVNPYVALTVCWTLFCIVTYILAYLFNPHNSHREVAAVFIPILQVK